METQDGTIDFHIPRQRLGTALNAFAIAAGWQVSASTALTDGVESPGVKGTYRREDGLRALLADTGLTYRFDGVRMVTIERDTTYPMPPAVTSPQSQAPMDEIDADVQRFKPIKVAEILVKEVRQRPTWTTPVDGYKADHASTVTRSTMSIDETPTSIGVVTRDVIRDTFSRTQGEAFEGVSRVSRTNSKQWRGEGFAIRGFEANDNFNGIKTNGLPADGVFAPD
ncbi:MAG: TonB-dependent receptor plug domain-containing protein [Nitrospira sp.]